MINLVAEKPVVPPAAATEARVLSRHKRRLRRAELTPRQIACLSLHYFDNLSVRQVAEEMHIGKSVVHEHLRCGNTRLAAVGLTARPVENQKEKAPRLTLLSIEDLDQVASNFARAVW